MSFFQASPGMQTAHIINGYEWGEYKTVVDVGGSHGAVALELVKRFPDMTVVVQDLPEVISSAPITTSDRITFQPYNFFTSPQPIKNADIYLFRMIFHNWGDNYCTQILRNLLPSLKPGAKIVINDHVVPEPGGLSAYKDRTVRAFDLVMKECFNARERDVGDWTKLVEGVDERLRIIRVGRPEGSQLQVIEVDWR
jgi:precorrin-6B methylase 2